MKILFLTNDCDVRSGRGRFTDEVIKRLSLKSELIVLGERIENSSVKESIFKLDEAKTTLSVISNIIKVLKFSRNADIIHCIDLWPFGLYAYISRLIFGTPYVICGVGTYSVAPLEKKFVGSICKQIYKNAKSVPCISNFTKNEIDKRVEGVNTTFVKMGLSKMNNLGSGSKILEEYNVVETTFPLIVTVGEVKSRKGQLNTAKAVAKLKAEYPSIKYLMVGKDFNLDYVEQIKKIDAEIGGNTIFHVRDAKTDYDLSAIYNRADIFALNSNNDVHNHFEGFGLVILEANQFGVPALGSKGCGIEDAIKEGVNGYLCEQDNIEKNHLDIAENMKKILEAKKNDKLFWKNKCIDWANSFDWDVTVSEYLRSYKD